MTIDRPDMSTISSIIIPTFFTSMFGIQIQIDKYFVNFVESTSQYRTLSFSGGATLGLKGALVPPTPQIFEKICIYMVELF